MCTLYTIPCFRKPSPHRIKQAVVQPLETKSSYKSANFIQFIYKQLYIYKIVFIENVKNHLPSKWEINLFAQKKLKSFLGVDYVTFSDSTFRIPHAKFQISIFKFHIPHSNSSSTPLISHPGFHIWISTSRIPHFDFHILNSKSQNPYSGFHIPQSTFRISHSGSHIPVSTFLVL